MPNPILSLFKELYGDCPQDFADEYLFQLCRLWTEHHSPATGTCPVRYTDPLGVTGLAEALTTYTDIAYWDIGAALLEDQGLRSTVLSDWGDEEDRQTLIDWHEGVLSGYDAHRAFEHIRVALLTLDRYMRVFNRKDFP